MWKDPAQKFGGLGVEFACWPFSDWRLKTEIISSRFFYPVVLGSLTRLEVMKTFWYHCPRSDHRTVKKWLWCKWSFTMSLPLVAMIPVGIPCRKLRSIWGNPGFLIPYYTSKNLALPKWTGDWKTPAVSSFLFVWWPIFFFLFCDNRYTYL